MCIAHAPSILVLSLSVITMNYTALINVVLMSPLGISAQSVAMLFPWTDLIRSRLIGLVSMHSCAAVFQVTEDALNLFPPIQGYSFQEEMLPVCH